MDALLGLLFFIAFIALIVGLINPKWVIRWGQSFSRKKVLLTYGIPALAFIIISIIFYPPPKDVKNIESESATTTIKKKDLAKSPPTTTTTTVKLTTTTNKPSPTPEEQAYAMTLAKQASEWGEAFSAIGKLFSNPQLGNDEWTINVATRIAQMRVLRDEAYKLRAPEKYRESHDKYMLAMSEFGWVADNLAIALDNTDANLLNQCVERIKSGADHVAEAAQLIKEAKNK